MTAPTCRRCGAPLGHGLVTDLVSAQQHHGELSHNEGALVVATVLAATSACSWNCLAVLAAQLAGPDADAAVQVVAERERQVTTEGWTPEHDDSHPPGGLALAGIFYAIEHVGPENPRNTPRTLIVDAVTAPWPWDAEWWKPKNPERDLVRAAALVAAEADRLVRTRRGRF